jgi:uncharacterized repeat protein (TIGR01451 family)
VTSPAARVVDNYLSADPQFSALALPAPYGAHANYTAVLPGLEFDTQYFYKVTGPGMPTGGFAASFHTRKKGSYFSFAVEGDEGEFPVIPNTSTPAELADYEARIAHLIYNAGSLSVAGAPSRPAPEFVVNTGDNVYVQGSEDNYRDFFFPIFNNDTDSNETGAPLLRSKLFFVVDGNHDLGSTGVTVNLLADNTAPLFSGNLGGGDALSYFNDLYYPLNGPAGVDIDYTFNGNSSVQNGMIFTFMGKTYTSAAAIEAFRASTTVDTGKMSKRQIDHQSNYSFDYGNTHFIYLDADPHLFDGNLPGGSASTTPAPPAFSAYPSVLRDWVINDLDSSKQTFKVAVFHQPSFSSGDATILNNQMRAVAKVLEDHGVNVVFNGHEHNYQRTLPIRATSRTAGTPSTTAGAPAVHVDQKYDGSSDSVPDGVLYIVEGAGGNRDFDGDLAPPRGSGLGVDQDDAATGTYTPLPGLTVEQGPADWLDTNLTNLEMVNNFPNAGTGTKITTKFKSRVFSFGHVVVDGNSFTLYQITEPLKSTSSGTATEPAPFGTDYKGNPLNDPIDDTVLNATTGALISKPETGTPALLDKWTITKPDLFNRARIEISAPDKVKAGGQITYNILVRNKSDFALNGAQIRLKLPQGVIFNGTTSDTLTVQGDELVYTVGRLAKGAESAFEATVQLGSGIEKGSILKAEASLTSGTALPVKSEAVFTTVGRER